MLTMRELQIANKMLTLNKSLRIQDLSNEFNVSSRSIKYDLENVKLFFKKEGISFCSSPGKGIWIECSESEKENALQALSTMQRNSLYYNQEVRVQKILLYLFYSNYYVTANDLAINTGVSRNTILHDIDYVDVLLNDSNVILNRKTGLGYSLEGSEIAIRTLIENLMQKSLSVMDVYLITERIKTGNTQKDLILPLEEGFLKYYDIIEKTLISAYDGHSSKMQQENIILMVIRQILSLIRVEQENYLDTSSDVDKGFESYYLYPYLKSNYENISLPVLKSELLYVYGTFDNKADGVDITKLTTDLILIVSKEDFFPYYEDTTLYSRLLSHLSLCLLGDKRDISENPFNTIILKNHHPLFLKIKSVCEIHLKGSLLLSNESFISYIVLHFLVAQNNLGASRKLRTIFVCASGRGAATLIAKMLKSEINEIEVVRHCSLMEVEEVIEELNPGLIISVFPIESTVPVVLVEPLPTKENIALIREIVKNQVKDKIFDYKKPLDLPLMQDTAEEISQEVIVVGLKIYNKLLQIKDFKIKAGLEFAFLSHILLLANRYYFNKQKKDIGALKEGKIIEISESLNEIDINLELGEVESLLYYLDFFK